MESTEKTNEPLASRLRDAAIDRTATDAERVDDFVLDADGVIDLRDLERDPLSTSVADPAKALATIRGQLGDAHQVANLYDESEPDRSRWRLGLRARHVFSQEATTAVEEKPADTTTVTPAPAPAETTRPPLGRLSMVPVSPTPDTETTVLPDLEVPDVPAVDQSPEPAIDLRDEDRPIADCPKCMGLGHRDLFDRFSQVEFYSCDNCMHMWQQDVG